MEYRRFDNAVVVRIDRGEEIIEKVKEVALKEKIRLGSVSALGAINKFTVGAFDAPKKIYISNDFSGNYEITSLTGTINTMNGGFYSHLHMSAGNEKGEVFGGHLNEAYVSGTCEMIINVIDGKVERVFDDQVGLNLFKFL